MQKVRFLFALACFAFVGCFEVWANDSTTQPMMALESQLQLSFADFDAVHATLVSRCDQLSPNSTPALIAAVDRWKNQNEAALQQLRQLLITGLMKGYGLSEADAKAQAARSCERMTEQLTNKLNQSTQSQLQLACQGQYASQTLGSPMFDFKALLTKMQASQATR